MAPKEATSYDFGHRFLGALHLTELLVLLLFPSELLFAFEVSLWWRSRSLHRCCHVYVNPNGLRCGNYRPTDKMDLLVDTRDRYKSESPDRLLRTCQHWPHLSWHMEQCSNNQKGRSCSCLSPPRQRNPWRKTKLHIYHRSHLYVLASSKLLIYHKKHFRQLKWSLPTFR